MNRPVLARAPRFAVAALLAAGLSCSTSPADSAETRSAREARIDASITSGRELLAARRPAEAQLVFEEAAALDGQSLRTRLWVLRSWMDQGRGNDAFDAIDELSRAGYAGPELDYLYGMAFARRAQGKLSLGDVDGTVQMNFEDAAGLLRSALEADPERFADAWPALAQSAWMSLDLPLAREAAERGVAAFPTNGDYRQLLGRITFSQFRSAWDETGGWNAKAEEQWLAALEAFDRAIVAYGAVDREGEEYVLADAWIQRANVLLWKSQVGEASAAYVEAIALAPDAVDYGLTRSLFDEETFRQLLEDGRARFDERNAVETSRDGALLWWLGYTRQVGGSYAAAEEALLESLAKEPAYTNAWFYVALSRQAREDWPGTVAALRAAWEADPPAVIAEMQTDLEPHLVRVSSVIDWCARQKRFEDAAVLARINAEAALVEPRYWSELGGFLRRSAEDASDEAAARTRYEEAFAAYQRALQLAPEDPRILNDAGALLHHHLRRELDRARLLYVRAQERARALLETGELSGEARALVAAALEDVTENLRLLEGELSETGSPDR